MNPIAEEQQPPNSAERANSDPAEENSSVTRAKLRPYPMGGE